MKLFKILQLHPEIGSKRGAFVIPTGGRNLNHPTLRFLPPVGTTKLQSKQNPKQLRFKGRIGTSRRSYSLIHSFTHSLIVLFFLSCGPDDRQTARIPDFPRSDDSSRMAGALTALTTAINQSSPASAYAKRAAVLLTMGRTKEALSDIDEAIDRNDNTGSYYLTRARVLRALQQPGKAIQDAQRAEILGVDTPELYTLQGDLLQQKNQFDKAKLYVARALQMAPYDGEAYFYNGLIAARQGDTAQALALYQQSLKLKPRFLETYNQLASIHRTQGDVLSALAYNQRASRYFPNNASLYYGRGMIYNAQGQADSAMQYYQQALTLQPNYYQVYFQMGLMNQKYRNYYSALANYRRVQELRPQFPRIDTYMGYCHEQLGQYDQAIAAYTKATTQNAADQQAAAGLWRSQRRQYAQNSYNSVLLPDTVAKPLTPVRTRPVLDTSRVRIMTIQPKATVRSNTTDSLQRTVKPIGQN